MEDCRTPGANYLGNGRCRFCVWAPLHNHIQLHILSPEERVLPLESSGDGYHRATIEGVYPGTFYVYRMDNGKEYPDPASRSQPQGVHGPSEVIEPHYPWSDSAWFGLPLAEYIIYELHVGTFSRDGTFEGIIPYLDYLKRLGITAIELMPVAQFPGERNWGYDGAYPFAVQVSYGDADGLKKLVDACHRAALAVILDVVYNHLGPEGSYLHDFAPVFTGQYQTPWGAAINFDGPHSDGVRAFFIANALRWITEFHIDALRLDALHAIMDMSAHSFIEEMAAAVHRRGEELNRRVYLFAESDRNDARLVRCAELGGYGLDALWNDDFHHALHALLTGERGGYYRDFGSLNCLAKSFREGFVYDGRYSTFRQRRHGSDSRSLPVSSFVVFSQNHDQIGNRALGERLSTLVSFESLKLAAGAVLLSPYIPLIFMGEEYEERAPFLYFTSHLSARLGEETSNGRRKEFPELASAGKVPDPQEEGTFLKSRLTHSRADVENAALLEFYWELIRLRRELPGIRAENREAVAYEREQVLFTRGGEVFTVFNFSDKERRASLPIPGGCWRKVLDSAEERWRGRGSLAPERIDSEGQVSLPLSPRAFLLFARE